VQALKSFALEGGRIETRTGKSENYDELLASPWAISRNRTVVSPPGDEISRAQ
jgi:hypothetical protein